MGKSKTDYPHYLRKLTNYLLEPAKLETQIKIKSVEGIG